MPRLAGQIDVAKNEAILDAAIEVLAVRGLLASMEEIARRAGVSKQTIYNHYGSKAELVHAIAGRRVGELTAPLAAPDVAGHPEEALANYAGGLLRSFLKSKGLGLLRLAVISATDSPEIAKVLYEAGVVATRRRLADFLSRETQAGRLNTPDPMQAAEFFAGMVGGQTQLAALLGASPARTDAQIEALAREVASRFVRAYSR